ncbi:MAG: hypothetical protein [Bacteriophage sp.]|nr:MAG: hypothetical protein [Bacteriophage sp.]
MATVEDLEVIERLFENGQLIINCGDDNTGWYMPLVLLSVYLDGDVIAIDMTEPSTS